MEPGLRGRVPSQCHPQPAEPGAGPEAARDPHRRREQHQGRGAVPAGPLPLRSVSPVGAYSVLLRNRYDPGGAGRVPQGERPSARFDREAHHRRLELRHRAAPGHAAERRPGTGDVVGRQGLQGPRAGVRRLPESRPLGRGAHDVARRASERSLQTGNELRSHVDRLYAVSQWFRDDPRVSGLRQRRGAERLELELGRTPEFPAFGQPLRLLRVPPTVVQPRQLLRGGRDRLAAGVDEPELEYDQRPDPGAARYELRGRRGGAPLGGGTPAPVSPAPGHGGPTKTWAVTARVGSIALPSTP